MNCCRKAEPVEWRIPRGAQGTRRAIGGAGFAAPEVDRARVCRVRARHCRRQLSGAFIDRGPRARPPLGLGNSGQKAPLEVLDSDRFADMAPVGIHNTPLDEGRYLGSARARCRLLASCDAARERLAHPVCARPELPATVLREAWSRDIAKLKGPGKWTCHRWYAILDIFGRHIVGWMIAARESTELAEQSIGDAAAPIPCVSRASPRNPRNCPRQPGSIPPNLRNRRPENLATAVL